MTLRWHCRQTAATGEITLPDAPIDLAELEHMVKTDHGRACRISGPTWLLFDLDRPGVIGHNKNSIALTVEAVKDPDVPTLVLCHIQ